MPGQLWALQQGLQDAAHESGVLHAHALHASGAVSLLCGPEVSAHLKQTQLWIKMNHKNGPLQNDQFL